MFNFVLCDDNQNILSRLSSMLDNIFIKYKFDAKVIFSSTDTDKLLEFISNNKVDVIFLDINLKSNKNRLTNCWNDKAKK